jgi:heme exporter protein D
MHTPFENMQAFITMGGYGCYVWPAYGLMFVILSLNVIQPYRRLRKIIARLRSNH